ncbi:MAG TPA: diguanylate cyclase [Patescibacteria group bacterium]|nr:diguanylate cyclase [Patescibacteria group bacterium]
MNMLLRYVLPVIALAGANAVNIYSPLFNDAQIFLPLVVVILTAIYAGRGPSLCITILAIIGYDYYFLGSPESFDFNAAAIAELLITGALVLLIVSVVDERNKAQRRAIELALSDPLTGLPNRRLLDEHTRIALAEAQRLSGRFALLYIDVDNFKFINDKWGHTVGDEVLKELAARLRACVRIHDQVYRIGGDEYAVLLSEITDLEDARSTQSAVHSALSGQAVSVGKEYFTLSCSIGIAVYPEQGRNLAELLDTSDKSMLEVKRTRRFIGNDHN